MQRTAQTTARHSRRATERGAERGISDVIGFTLMFSIIIIGVGLVSLTGVTQINTLSDAEEVRTAERGLESSAATLEGMNQQNDLNRTMSLAFANGDIWLNQTTLNIRSNRSINYGDISINSLEHRFDRSNEDITVRYEGGGVFRSDGAFPSYEPTFTCRTSGSQTTAIITVVNLTLEDEREGISIGSGYDPSIRFNEFAVSEDAPITSVDKVLTLRARLVDTDRNVTQGGPTEVIVDATETSGPDQWDEFFNESASDDRSGWQRIDDAEYGCVADQTLIRVTTVELEIVDPRFAG